MADPATMPVYRIRNWAEYQHYGKRCPPWIKLHWELLQSEDWVSWDDASRVLAVASMLLASRSRTPDGRFNGDPKLVQRIAYLNQPPDFKPLIECGFLLPLADASTLHADASTLHADASTIETEEETETEAEYVRAHVADHPEPDPSRATRPPMTLTEQFRAKLKAAFPRTANVAVDEYVGWMQRRVSPATIETLYATLESLSVAGGADAFTPSIGALESAYRKRGGKFKPLPRMRSDEPADTPGPTCSVCGQQSTLYVVAKCDLCKAPMCDRCHAESVVCDECKKQG